MNIIDGEIAQQVEDCLEDKLACFKALLGLTQEQVKITKGEDKEEHIDLKGLDLILQQKEDQLNMLKRIDHSLKGLNKLQAVKEKMGALAQIIRELVALEEISYQNLSTSQLALKEEMVNHQRIKGLTKVYINRPAQTAYPKFMERQI